MALWEVPLCALPSDKGSFPRERGAALEHESKGRVGPQEAEGGPDSQAEVLGERASGVCLHVCI